MITIMSNNTSCRSSKLKNLCALVCNNNIVRASCILQEAVMASHRLRERRRIDHTQEHILLATYLFLPVFCYSKPDRIRDRYCCMMMAS